MSSEIREDSTGDMENIISDLSAETRAALMEFYQEQAALREKEESTAQQPKEDWELSQFWYSDETAEKLCHEVIRALNGRGRVACVSCPTLYIKLMDIKPAEMEAYLFEYDDRFSKYDNFVKYDYREPNALPETLVESFDLVVADPPFLSEECLTKTAITLRRLSNSPPDGKLLLLTGAKQEELALRLLNVRVTKFEVKHTNNLMNQFICFANYDASFEN